MIKDLKIEKSSDIKKVLANALNDYNLPNNKNAKMFLKPNFNNDLISLTGNSTDLRLLKALIEAFSEMGYLDITVGDAPNAGIFLKRIDVLERLGVRKLCKELNVKCVDLNYTDYTSFDGEGKNKIHASKQILEADFIINIPKIKVHADAVFSCCVKNYMGINVGESSFKLHENLMDNLYRNINIRPPDLNVVDGIIGMEGNGPGDGDPILLNRLIIGEDAFLLDYLIAKSIGLNPNNISYLSHKIDQLKNHRDNILDLPIFTKPDSLSFFSKIIISSKTKWIRNLFKPLIDMPWFMNGFYKLGVVQDVYNSDNGDYKILIKEDIDEKWIKEICPGNWGKIKSSINSSNGNIVVSSSIYCYKCMYCVFADKKNIVILEGKLGYLANYLKRFKKKVESIL